MTALSRLAWTGGNAIKQVAAPIGSRTNARAIATAATLRSVCVQRLAGPGLKPSSRGGLQKSSRSHRRGSSRALSVKAAAADDADDGTYRLPPDEIATIVDAPPTPSLAFSPKRDKLLMLARPPSNPPVSELARPELKLAGLRIDPEIHSRSRMGYYTGISIIPMDAGYPPPEEAIMNIEGIPEGAMLNFVSWSYDGTYLGFTVRYGGEERRPLELWVADVATGKARELIPGTPLNTIFDEYLWLDDENIIACIIPEGQAAPPKKPVAPPGPKIQAASMDGKKAQTRTYSDLLTSKYDEDLLEHYCSSELIKIHVPTGEVSKLGPKKMYSSIDPSPDKEFLLVSTMERPFSYEVPCGRFPSRVELWTAAGDFVKEIVYHPLLLDMPIAFNAVRKGRRSIYWRPDKGAEIHFVVAQDEGDPAIEASPRDIAYTMPAAGGEPKELVSTDLRYGGVSWCDGDLALVYESWWATRALKTYTMAPDRPEEGKVLFSDRSSEDAYSDPGSPVLRRTKLGSYVIARMEGGKLLFEGTGASPEGNRPFLDVVDLASKETDRIWQSSPPYFEVAGSLMNDSEDDEDISLDGLQVLVSRETRDDPSDYFIRTFKGKDGKGEGEELRFTKFPHPYPSLANLQKEIVRYKREDGTDLTGTLYLPPGYDKDKDGPLPCLLWCYPREFKTKDAAGQMRDSPHRFTGIGNTSPLLFLSLGYAIFDGPTMPIIGEEDEEANDTYVEQLVMSAKAAVEEVVRRGVADPKRVAVGGHSYGAFTTANLLAHCGDLFCCGIARSGAYNRTLTPFGFQAEERTLWQCPETYMTMSPFMLADKIKKPILLIHGEDDNNTGTFPMQSERFFAALKGHGAPTRLVILPHESHGYRGRESVMHMLWEMEQWLAKHASGESAVEEAIDAEAEVVAK